MRYIAPQDLFTSLDPKRFPEIKELNPERYDDIKRLIYAMEAGGVAFGIGDSINRETMFDLYLPFITLSENRPNANFGANARSEIGGFYFYMHDAYHIYAGIPGPRKKDLLNPKASKEKWINTMISKEWTATAWSALDYIRYYWNWRYRAEGGTSSQFENINRGAFSMADVSRQQLVDQLGHFSYGRIWRYMKSLRQNMNSDYMRQAQELGVPNLGIDVSAWLSPANERRLFRLAGPIVESIFSYFRSNSGYTAFRDFSAETVDYYLQPWYVEWADDYKYGIPLDELEARQVQLRKDIAEGRPLKEVVKPTRTQFQVRYLRNQIAIFGRKLAELKELLLRNPKDLPLRRAEIFGHLRKYNSKALELVSTLDSFDTQGFENQNTVLTGLEDVEAEFIRMLGLAENHINISKDLPLHLRLGFVDYSHFWRDPTAILIKGSKMMTGFFPPEAIHDSARKQRRGWNPEASAVVGSHIQKFINSVGRVYNNALKGASGLRLNTGSVPAVGLYFQRLDFFRMQFEFQVESVVKPMAIDTVLGSELKRKIFERLDRMKREIDTEIRQLYALALSGQPTDLPEDYVLEQIEENLELLLKLSANFQGKTSEKEILEILDGTLFSQFFSALSKKMNSQKIKLEINSVPKINRVPLATARQEQGSVAVYLMNSSADSDKAHLSKELASRGIRTIRFVKSLNEVSQKDISNGDLAIVIRPESSRPTPLSQAPKRAQREFFTDLLQVKMAIPKVKVNLYHFISNSELAKSEEEFSYELNFFAGQDVPSFAELGAPEAEQWISDQRLAFENAANAYRGLSAVNLLNPPEKTKLNSYTIQPVSRAYVPLSAAFSNLSPAKVPNCALLADD
ncbi:MAG: hypothetical protein K2X47_19040 [Bdellovibrionales bacterium]|nr:hypothetical protein [Bdellovibrionales bacterium]